MTNSTSADALLHYVNRIEALEEEKAGVADHIKVVFADLKANGFDPRVVRAIIKERKVPAADRAEFEQLMDAYRAALGMLPADVPTSPTGATLAEAEHADPETGEIVEETWEQPRPRAAGRRKAAA